MDSSFENSTLLKSRWCLLLQGETNKTPASARHKRGCNCKKSSCLKKYCECFQVCQFSSFCIEMFSSPIWYGCCLLCMKAGVGCSPSCRCEGCKNRFGRKGGESLSGTVWLNTNINVWNWYSKVFSLLQCSSFNHLIKAICPAWQVHSIFLVFSNVAFSFVPLGGDESESDGEDLETCERNASEKNSQDIAINRSEEYPDLSVPSSDLSRYYFTLD